jgi:hypothetical protein
VVAAVVYFGRRLMFFGCTYLSAGSKNKQNKKQQAAGGKHSVAILGEVCGGLSPRLAVA